MAPTLAIIVLTLRSLLEPKSFLRSSMECGSVRSGPKRQERAAARRARPFEGPKPAREKRGPRCADLGSRPQTVNVGGLRRTPPPSDLRSASSPAKRERRRGAKRRDGGGVPSFSVHSRARAGLCALEPGGDVLVVGIDRLADLGPEIEEAVEQDVGQREAVAGDPLASGDQAVEPGELLLGGGLQVGGGGGDAVDPLLEHLQAFGIAEAVG